MTGLFSMEVIQVLAAAALAFSVLMYVLLDGTDLGTGMLYAVHRREEDRHLMTLSLLPVWDGNETWLVLGGGGLLALFPAAYGIFFSALYLPAFAMLLALVLRGMAVEYRDHVRPERRPVFDAILMAGSALAAASQGVMMGAFIQGIPNNGVRYTGDGWEWCGLFPLFCGLALMAGYALLGNGWLIWRTEGRLQARARRHGRILGIVTLLLLIALVIWTASLHALYARRLGDPRLICVPAGLLLACGAGYWYTLNSQTHLLPLCMTLGGTLAAFATLVLAVYPQLIPPTLSIAGAAAPPLSQGFMLTGFAVLIPITLAYNSYGFWVFHGKIRYKPAGESQPDE